jgi:hypothetical protein
MSDDKLGSIQEVYEVLRERPTKYFNEKVARSLVEVYLYPKPSITILKSCVTFLKRNKRT